MDFGTILGNGLRAAFGVQAVIYAMAAIGLNLHFGYGGLVNFGQIGFVMLGAYGVGVAVATWGWSLWLGILVGLVASAVFALLLGIPTLRLRADYFAITTIAAAEILRLLIRSTPATDLTGGPFGLQGLARDFYDLNPIPSGRYGVGTFEYTSQQLWVMLVGWVLVALATLFIWQLTRSPWGRVVRAIREDEDAVRSLGKSAFSYKIQSLVLGGMIGALAGFIQALRLGNVNPDQYHTTFTFYIYAVLILGGAARVFGPVVGAMLFWGLYNFLNQLLRQVAALDVLPEGLLTTTKVDPLVFVLLGAGIIALLIFRPQGIFGDRREISLDVR